MDGVRQVIKNKLSRARVGKVGTTDELEAFEIAIRVSYQQQEYVATVVE